ncbi:MAG: metallophosphoesterase, partial [archaeon]
MNRILSFLIFFSIFFIIYFGMHFYVFTRMSTLLAINRSVLYYIIMAVMALSFPAISMIERANQSGISRAAYIGAGVWLGALFFAFCALIIYEIIRFIIKLDQRAAGITIIIVVAAVVIYGIISAMTITVKQIEVPMPNLEKELTIVQLSDIHLGSVHNSEYMKRIVEKTNEINPDMVLITGDLYDGSRKVSEEAITNLDNIKAKTFFTTGNHEQFQGVEEVLAQLKKTKVQILRNEVA